MSESETLIKETSEFEDLFVRASREGYRFPSVRGELTTEQLWQLPLSSTTTFDLDNVAKEISRQIKTLAGESFVRPKQNTKACAVLENQLAIVVFVIKTKQEEAKAATNRKAISSERAHLLQIARDKKDQVLIESPLEEIERKIKELDSQLETA